MFITSGQSRRIHQLLNKANLIHLKGSIVASFTDGRTSSSKEMSVDEAKMMITHLENWMKDKVYDSSDSANQMRRKIIAMAHKMQWYENGKIDMARINGWCISKGYLNKELNDYTSVELPKLVSQFQQVYKSYLKS